jgi:hypothetical protein
MRKLCSEPPGFIPVGKAFSGEFPHAADQFDAIGVVVTPEVEGGAVLLFDEQPSTTKDGKRNKRNHMHTGNGLKLFIYLWTVLHS